MTARKDFKNLIRARMRKTGESYTAARRSFLHPQENTMTVRDSKQATNTLRLSLDHLSLTLKTVHMLKAHRIVSVGQLVGKSEHELAAIGLGQQRRVEVRYVLASRGL